MILTDSAAGTQPAPGPSDFAATYPASKRIVSANAIGDRRRLPERSVKIEAIASANALGACRRISGNGL